MKLVFLIPLTIGLVTGYISQNADEDIKYITAVISAITLILSLIFAPWQIQLLILILVLTSKSIFGRRREYRANFTPNQLEKLNSERQNQQPVVSNSVSLGEIPGKYRGVFYEAHSATTAFTEGEVAGKYRGTPWRIHQMSEVDCQQPHYDIKYRGLSMNGEKNQGVQDKNLGNIQIPQPRLINNSPGLIT